MRNRYAKGQRAAALAGILALALVAGSGRAWAQDDEGEPLDTKLFRGFMKEMGFQRSEQGIDRMLAARPSRDGKTIQLGRGAGARASPRRAQGTGSGRRQHQHRKPCRSGSRGSHASYVTCAAARHRYQGLVARLVLFDRAVATGKCSFYRRAAANQHDRAPTRISDALTQLCLWPGCSAR